MRACPDEISGTRFAPRAGREGIRLHRHEVVGHIQRTQDHPRDLVVTQRVQVESVVIEEPGILNLFERPLVGDDAVVAVCDGAQVFVIDRDLPAKRAEDGSEARVDAREDHDCRAGAAQTHDRILEQLRDLVRVGTGPDDVVAPRAERDQVGRKLECRLDLFVDDLGDEFAAHREICVCEVF